MRLPVLLLAAALTAIVGSAAAQESKVRQSLLPPAPRYMVSESAMKTVRNPRAIEQESGGRLGVALVDSKGALLLGFNRDERFAMCSTFKAPLAAAVLMGADAGRFGLGGQVAFSQSDILDYAPVVKANRKRGRLSMAELAEAAVEVSDNSAANLLLPMIGGPEGLTAFVRAHGDSVTRLDRTEPGLNENAEGDPRDTTSPAAMAANLRRLVLGKALSPASRDRLAGWLIGNRTGDARLRAGAPKTWRIADKTGSGENGTTNDVGVMWPPAHGPLVVTVYLTASTGDGDARNAVLAEVGRIAAGTV